MYLNSIIMGNIIGYFPTSARPMYNKEDFEQWKIQQKDDLEELKKNINESLQYHRELVLQQIEIIELKKQLESLKVMNEEFKNSKSQTPGIKKNKVNIPENNSDKEIKNTLRLASNDIIKDFVNDLITSEHVNIKYLPDFVEEKIYKNIFNISLGIIDKLLENINVEIIGHRITFDLSPIQDDESKEPLDYKN